MGFSLPNRVQSRNLGSRQKSFPDIFVIKRIENVRSGDMIGMAVIKAFAIPGIHCCFYSNDHEPPHFHAKRRGHWHARVHFLLVASEAIEIVRGKITGPDSRRLANAIELHRKALLNEWKQIHG
jgi:hypothetical protein